MSVITWPEYTPRTRYGYAPRESCDGPGAATVAVAVILSNGRGLPCGEWYRWSLIRGQGEGVELSRDDAECKAEAAYRHARGLLGSVTP